MPERQEQNKGDHKTFKDHIKDLRQYIGALYYDPRPRVVEPELLEAPKKKIGLREYIGLLFK